MLPRRPNYEVVLRWLRLSEDNEVEFTDGFTYAMIVGEVCVKLQCYKHGKFKGEPTEIQWSVSEMGLNWFIDQCRRLEEDTIVLMCANLALNALNPKR